MIDYNEINNQLPTIKDYAQGSDGKWYKKSELEKTGDFVDYNPNAGFIDSTINKIGADFKTTNNSILALGADMVGAESTRDQALKDVERQQKISGLYTKDYQDVTKLNGPMDALKYAGFQGANFVAQALPLLVAGGVGGAIQGGIPGAVAGAGLGGAEALTGGSIIKGLLTNLIQKNAQKLAIGSVAGLQNVGQVNAQNLAETGQQLNNQQALESFGTGAVLGTIEGQQLLGNLGKTSTRLGNGLMTGAVAGTTGVIQAGANRNTLDKELMGEGSTGEYINAFVGGALGGGVMGLAQKPRNAINDVVDTVIPPTKPEDTVNTTPNDINTLLPRNNETLNANSIDSNTPNNLSTDNINVDMPVQSVQPNITDSNIVKTNLSEIGGIKNLDTYLKTPDETIDTTNVDSNLVNLEQNKPSLEGLSTTRTSRINEITETLKNEDGTISQEKLNLINNLVNFAQTKDLISQDVARFLGKVKKSVNENTSDAEAKVMNAKFETILGKKMEDIVRENQEFLTNENIDPNTLNTKVKEDLANENNIPKQEVLDNPFVQVENIKTPKIEENINKVEESINNAEKTTNIPEPLKQSVIDNNFSNKLQSLTREQVYKNIKQAEEINPLDIKERLELNNIEKSIDSIRNNVNVDIMVIPEKYSPFGSEKNAWFDDKNNRIVLVGTQKTKDNLQNVLGHELWHKGIVNSVNENGLLYVRSSFDELYKNNTIKQYADNFIKSGMDKYTAIEEAVGHATENNLLGNTSFTQKVFDTIKNVINTIIGKDLKLSNEDVKSFFNKTVDTVFKTPEEQKLAVDVTQSIFKFSGNQEEQIRNSRTDFENSKKLESAITQLTDSTYKDYVNEAQIKMTYGNNLTPEQIKNAKSPFTIGNKLLRSILTVDGLLRKFGGEKIHSYTVKQNSFKGNLEYQYQSNSIKMNDIVSKNKISKTELDLLNNYLGRMGYLENNGLGRRIGEAQIRSELAGKVSDSKLNSLVEYANLFRESADDGIYFNAMKDTVSLIDPTLSSLRKTNKDVADIIETAILQVSKNQIRSNDPNVLTARNIGVKINEVLTQNASKFSQETIDLLSPIMKKIDEQYKDADTKYNNGFLPRDTSGKNVVEILDKNGNKIAVVPFEKKTDSFNYFATIKKQFGDSFLYNIYELERNINSNIDINKVISESRKTGRQLTDSDLQRLATLNKLSNDYLSNIKASGYNEKLSNVVHNYSYNQIKQMSETFLTSNIDDFINTLSPNSVEKNIMLELVKQQQVNQEISNKTGDKVLKNIRQTASVFALGLNLANTTAQMFQSTLIGISNAQKYGDSTNVKFFKADKVIKDGYKVSDPETQAIINSLKNNELLGSSMTKQMFEDTSKFHDKTFKDTIVQALYKPNEIIEKRLRMATLLRSVDAYKKARDGKLSPEVSTDILNKSMEDFVVQQLSIVNGDFSKGNRSKILQGEFFQTLLMFQQWKSMTIQAWQQMDMKGKATFIVGQAFAGGILGLPFAQDLEDTFDFFAKMFGKNMPAKKAVNDTIKMLSSPLEPIFGAEGANQIVRSGIPGIGERLGLGSIIPSLKGGIEALNGETEKGFKDIFGPASNFTMNIARATGNVMGNIGQGDLGGAVGSLVPATPGAFKNIVNGIKSFKDQATYDERGNKILKNTDAWDSAFMLFGLNTSEVSNTRYKQSLIQDYKNGLKKIRSGYVQDIKSELNSNDPDKFKNISEIKKEATKNGFIIDISEIREEMLKNTDVIKKNLNSLSVRDRFKAKRELGI